MDEVNLQVNVCTSNKETLCMMLAVINNIQELKVNICDNANKLVKKKKYGIDSGKTNELTTVANILDFNPPIG